MTRLMEGLTGGAVLVGLLLALGANEVVIGIAAATPFLAQVAQIGALRLAFWWRSRRRICLTAALASRALLMVGGIASVLAPSGDGLLILVLTLAASSAAAAVAAFSWAYWMRDLVPSAEYGRVFARRFAWQSASGLGGTVSAGAFLSWAGVETRLAFGALFAIGGFLGLGGLLFVMRLPDVSLNPADGPETPAQLFQRAVAGGERRPLAFAALWGAAATMAVPFVPVFLLADLHAPFVLVATLSAVSVLSALVTASAWGRLTDRVGCKPVLAFAAAASALAVVGLVLVEDTGRTGLSILLGVHAVMGAALAAVEIALGKLIARSAPFNRAGGFLAVAGMARALGSGLGVLMGGAIASFASARALSFVTVWSTASYSSTIATLRISHYDLVFALSGLLMLYAAHRVLGLTESRASSRRVNVLHELHVELSGLSPFRGARSIGAFAHHAGRLVRERRHARVAPASPCE